MALRLGIYTLIFSSALILQAATGESSLPTPGRFVSFEPAGSSSPAFAQYLAHRPGFDLFLGQSGVEMRSASGAPVRMRFVGGSSRARPSGIDRQVGVTNYLLGSRSAWRLNVPNFSRIRYSAIYPGIDLEFYGAGDTLEYDWIIQPGADLSKVRMSIEGAVSVETEFSGDLLLRTGNGILRQSKPRIYQESTRGRVAVNGRFAVEGSLVRFVVDKYDATQPLVIDPAVVYSTNFGGNTQDILRGIGTDGSGNIYVAGLTTSTSFSYPSANPPGGGDVFVTKLSPDGQTRLYTTYLGGTGAEDAGGLAVDSAGNAYVAGSTASTDFAAVGAAIGSPNDAFVVKLSPTGSILYGKRIGGAGGASAANAVAINGSGNAYITGTTSSSAFSLVSPRQGAYGGSTSDAFVTKLSTDGASILFSTYLGGSGADVGTSIAVDTAGNAIVGGRSNSTDFLASGGDPLAAPFTARGFVTKYASDGSSIAYSNFTGEQVFAVGVDSSGSAYATGTTYATASFNTHLLNLVQAQASGAFGFLTKFSAGAVTYSNLLAPGGPGSALAIDSNSNVYISGNAVGPLERFPLVSAVESSPLKDSYAAFVMKLPADASTLTFSSLFSGATGSQNTNGTNLNSIAVHPTSGRVFVAGSTIVADLPVADALQPTNPASVASGALAFIDTATCAISATGPAAYIPSSGGTVNVQVTAASNCSWNAPAGNSWIHRTSPSSGIGNSVVSYSVDANGQSLKRSGTVAPGGQIFGISQLGSSCTYRTYPERVLMSALGGSGEFLLDTQPGCTWSFASASGWPVGSPNQGTGPQKITYTADPLPASTSRGDVFLIGTDGNIPFFEFNTSVPTGAVPHSVNPVSGSGSSQQFSFKFYDANGSADFGVLNMLVNGALDGRQGCYLAYVASQNVLYLVNDAGDNLLAGQVVSSAGTTSNSQCTVSWSGGPNSSPSSTVYISGKLLTLNLTFSFPSGFAGNKVVYQAARTAASVTSGWQAMGTFVIPGEPSTGTITVNNAQPARGILTAGEPQTIAFNFTDTAGVGNFGVINMLVNSALDGRQGCYLAYVRSQNILYLVDDTGFNLLPANSLGAIGSTANSQCMVTWNTAAVTANGNNLTITLTFLFSQAFGGNKIVFAAARDQNDLNNTGWHSLGSLSLQ